jgi:hypothetical protein
MWQARMCSTTQMQYLWFLNHTHCILAHSFWYHHSLKCCLILQFILWYSWFITAKAVNRIQAKRFTKCSCVKRLSSVTLIFDRSSIKYVRTYHIKLNPSSSVSKHCLFLEIYINVCSLYGYFMSLTSMYISELRVCFHAIYLSIYI